MKASHPAANSVFRTSNKALRHPRNWVYALVLVLLAPLANHAADRFVALGGTHVPPFVSWSTAATNIQAAIDAASDGETIWVTNGVYEGGVREVYGMSNRVAITKPVVVRSVNGPEATIIKGYQVPGTTNGPAAVRCVYLTNGAALVGFTLTNGATQTSGDLYKQESGGGIWAESTNAVVSNCVLTGNSARSYGGGSYYGTLSNCTLTGNWAGVGGGGSSGGTLNNCTLAGNSVRDNGGGSHNGSLNNCTLMGNSAGSGGGGSSGGTLNNCTLNANSAGSRGGGAFLGSLTNCTLTANSARLEGGGFYWGTLINCIIYFNDAPSSPNYFDATLNYCCSTPLASGTGNLSSDPRLASASHLTSTSPCRGAGSTAYTSGVDVDGDAWANPPSIGCDEYLSGSVTGALSVAVASSYTNVAVGFNLTLRALIGGRAGASRWNFGDGIIISNQPFATHAWSAAGEYVIELRAYNETHPAGISANLTVKVENPVHYVALNSTSPAWPYSSWATAARNIQDAVDATVLPGAVVLVSNGVYEVGARAVYGMSNRVAVTKPVVVRSLNGPGVTSIKGYQVPGTTNGAAAVRCVYLTNEASLIGFTLTNGATQISGATSSQQSGGGVWAESTNAVVSNCVLAGNSAGSYGGGAYYGLFNGCIFAGNSARDNGGGSYYGALGNCTLTGNSALDGGGASYGILDNCALTGNSARRGGGGSYYGTLSNCTLTGNWAGSGGGGSYYGILDNCSLSGNSAGYYGGGSYSNTLNNCTLSNNMAGGSGGGSYYGALNNCTLAANSAGTYGGGSYSNTLNNCTLSSNSAGTDGGGAYYGVLNNCRLSGNSARYKGGGSYYGTLNNCTLTGNWAGSYGGGSYYGILNNCTLAANSAYSSGGGAYYGVVNNCNLIGNSAFYGGGVYAGTLNNCIIYFNKAPNGPNYSSLSTLNYCCSTPLASGTGNLSLDPQLASASHLSATSPCRGAGSAADASGVDVDGDAWGNPPSIGCDEYLSGSVTGALSVAIASSYTNVAVGFNISLQALISGRVSASRWNFGDGVVVSNQPLATHAWSATGDYVIELRAYNETYPAGISANLTVKVENPVHYVALNSASPAWPYSSWATAATNIQDAIDATVLPGAVVLVSNGVYEVGARAVYGVSNRVALTKPVVVRGLNGAGTTIIKGYQVPGITNGVEAIRCVYLTNGGSLIGFTLTNGATQTSGDPYKQGCGGGVWAESTNAVVSNCVLAGNSAASYGGGSYYGLLTNCILAGNSARYKGGGSYYGALGNCTLTGNSALEGGGAFDGTLDNCALSGNSAGSSGGGSFSGTLDNCAISGNSAGSSGGGSFSGTLDNCALSGNSAGSSGGGSFSGTLKNCTLSGNSAGSSGGGSYSGTLKNCTLSGNLAGSYGGGSCYDTLNNCIIYYNSASSGFSNSYYSTLNYCCSSPLASGTGNLSSDPQLASGSHLSATSPCRGAGSAAYASGVDMDGEPWANPPSIGCDEYWSGSATGALSVAIAASYTNVAVGSNVSLKALIGGRASASRWDFGDGVVLSNQPFATHAWSAAGEYRIELTAYNATFPNGVKATLQLRVEAGTLALGAGPSFGNTAVGSSSYGSLWITNRGTKPLKIEGIRYSTNVFSGDWSGTLPAGSVTNALIAFTPAGALAYTGTLTVVSYAAATNGSATIALSGTGLLHRPAPQEALVAYYPFDGTPNDVSGNARNASLPAGGAYTNGALGQAIRLNGTSQQVELPGASVPTNFTFAAWVKVDQAPALGTSMAILLGSTAEEGAYLLDYANYNGFQLRFRLWTTAWQAYAVPATLTPGTWHHVAVTKNANGSASIYLNGELAGSFSGVPAPASNYQVSEWRLGRSGSADSTPNFLAGSLDEVRIYDRVLEPVEIQQLYRAGLGMGLLAYYPFDGTANDVGGSGRNATVSGAPSYTPAVWGKGATLNGSTDYLMAPVNLNNETNVSMAFWLKLTKWPANRFQPVSNDSGSWGRVLAILGTSDGLGRAGWPELWNSAGVGNNTWSNALPTNLWFHVAAVWTENYSKLFVNGFEVLSIPGTIAGRNDSTQVSIGAGRLSERTAGTFDELRIYNRALSTAEVRLLASTAGTSSKISLQPGIANNGQFVLSWPTISGRFYQVQYRTNITLGAWEPLGGAVWAAGSSVSVTNPVSGNTQKYYRLEAFQ